MCPTLVIYIIKLNLLTLNLIYIYICIYMIKLWIHNCSSLLLKRLSFLHWITFAHLLNISWSNPVELSAMLEMFYNCTLQYSMFSACLLSQFGWKNDSSLIFHCWFSVWMICPLVTGANWSFLLLLYCVFLLWNLLIFAQHI